MNALNVVDAYAFYKALKEGAEVTLGNKDGIDTKDMPDIILFKKDNTLFLNLDDKVLEPLEILKLMKRYSDVNKVIINLDLTLDYKTSENYVNALNTAEKKIKDYYHSKAKVFTKLFKFLKDKVIAEFIAAVYSLVKVFVNISKFIATTIFKLLKNIGKLGTKLLQSAINAIKKESYIAIEQDNAKPIANTMVYIRLHVSKDISEHELFNSILNIQLQDLDTYTILTKTVVISKFDKLYTINFPERFQIIKIFAVGAPFELDIDYNYNEKTRFLDINIRRQTKFFSVSTIEETFIIGAYIILFAAIVGVVFEVGVLTALGYGSAQLLNESILYAFYALVMRSIISVTILSGIALAFLKSHEIKRILKQLGLIRENQIIIKVIEDQDSEEAEKLEKQIRDKARKKIKRKHHRRHRDRKDRRRR